MALYKKIFILVTFLCLFGILMVYSSSQIWAEYKMNNEYYFLIRQSLFFLIGFCMMILVSRIDYMYYKKYASYIYFCCLILLILVLIPGIGLVRGGARSWIGVGQFTIQPSEFIKFALIIIFSKYLSNHDLDIKKLKYIILLGIFLLLNFFLIMLQPDFGTAVVLLITISILIFIAGINMKYVILAVIGIIIGFGFMIVLSPYRLERIFSFLNPWEDPLGSGFQIIQSLYAISPNGLFGLGLFNSIQKFYYLPEPQTDFIFAIITEELGLIGAIFLIYLFSLFFYYGLKTAINIKNKFGMYLSIGITSLIFVQFFINIGVVIGLLPVTGITLPFISYGGSSLALNLISVGILINISKSVKEY